MNKRSTPKKTKTELLLEVEELTAALQRERADLLNLRQRSAKDKLLLDQQARTAILLQFLPILDNLQRAFALPPEEIIDQAWVKGVLGIKQQLNGFLKQLEIQTIEVLQKPFDPNSMEAVAAEPNPKLASETVIEEVRRGYLYQDRVLRPAQVKVVKND